MAFLPGTNTGHGRVWTRPDGVKMRCGGPGLCRVCSQDLRDSTKTMSDLKRALTDWLIIRTNKTEENLKAAATAYLGVTL